MMSDIRKGKINFILVTDFARLSRNLLDFCVLQNDLVKYGSKFLSMKEQFDTSTAAGEMMILNVMNLAQFERKQTSERVTMNFRSRATRGLRSGGAPVLNVIRIASEMKPNSLASQTLEEELEGLGKKKLEYRNAIQNLEYQILDLREMEDPRRTF